MRFSIIVPCYNVEKYINECVESILRQDFEDYEVLLIDDGSTDQTCNLCDIWGDKDDRIHVFHKRNGGLSDARNYGIRHAKGDYLVFLDSDDFINESSLLAFNSCSEGEPEVILTRLVEYIGKFDIRERDVNMAIVLPMRPSVEEAINWNMNGTQDSWAAPKKIVRRNFVVDNSLWFKVGYLHEDIDWTVRLSLVARKYASCSYPWYFYRSQREDSINNTVRAKSITDVIEMSKELIGLCEKSGSYCKNIIEDRIIDSLFVSINKCRYLDTEEKSAVTNCLKENSYLLVKAKKNSHKLFALACKILGVRNAINLLSFFNV